LRVQDAEKKHFTIKTKTAKKNAKNAKKRSRW
jgi:hypothetical protein